MVCLPCYLQKTPEHPIVVYVLTKLWVQTPK